MFLFKKYQMKLACSILSAFLLFLSCTSCDGNDNVTPEIPQIDTTTTLRSVTESGGYATFYKPQTGFVRNNFV